MINRQKGDVWSSSNGSLKMKGNFCEPGEYQDPPKTLTYDGKFPKHVRIAGPRSLGSH
jgi:hypothetical protein